jgi:hypothetical protein
VVDGDRLCRERLSAALKGGGEVDGLLDGGAVVEALSVTLVGATLTLLVCAETLPIKSAVKNAMPIVKAKRPFARIQFTRLFTCDRHGEGL